MIKKMIECDDKDEQHEKIFSFLEHLKMFLDVNCADHEITHFVKKSRLADFATGYFIRENKGNPNETAVCVGLTMNYLEKQTKANKIK